MICDKKEMVKKYKNKFVIILFLAVLIFSFIFEIKEINSISYWFLFGLVVYSFVQVVNYIIGETMYMMPFGILPEGEDYFIFRIICAVGLAIFGGVILMEWVSSYW